LTPLISQTNDAWLLYEQDIKAKTIIHDGVEYLALDLHNAKIMKSRFDLLWYFEKEHEKLNGDLWLMEGELQAEKEKNTLKDKLRDIGIIGLSVIVLVETLIIILPR
jgi:hypothetical protein